MGPGTSTQKKANVKTRRDRTTTDMDLAGEPGGALPGHERTVIAGVLALIALLAAMDLLIDLREGVTPWHVLTEGMVAVLACLGAFHLLRGAWRLRRRLEAQDRDFSAFRLQAEAWRMGSRKYLDGLSRSIDLQLDQWQLSVAEKDVAFLLLKGLSLKEIAAARGTTEKTARVQSSAVYAKSGLAGRSELSAFFLEDLLPPGTASADTGSGELP
jgi:DNA-binding CsgD family transcriptional regulator